MRTFLLCILCCLAKSGSPAQGPFNIRLLTSGTNTSLRGMSLPAKNIVWVSGSNGTIGRSVNNGNTWQWMVLPGFEKRDFRDIEAFDSSTAIAMAVDNPAIIVKTTDGGATWRKVFERSIDGMFLDAMDFKNKKEGICIGDPLRMDSGTAKRFYIIKTLDAGDTWNEIAVDEMPAARPGEAIFAASGTNIYFLNHPVYDFAFVTGGLAANLHLIGKKGVAKTIPVPIVHGKESAGVFSMATDRRKTMYCAGGDYKLPNDTAANYVYTTDAGAHWSPAVTNSPAGYRSGISIVRGNTLVTCGTSGVDYTKSAGREWQKAGAESFNVCMTIGGQIFLAGEKGKVGRMTIKH